MAENRRIVTLATTGFILILAFGCSTTTQSETSLSGNWAFTSASSQTSPKPLALNVGFTNGSTEAVSGIAHLTGASCVNAGTSIALEGTISPENELVIISKPFAGSTVSLKGQLSANGKTISNANWTFNGGSCASLGTGKVNATAYDQINGTYSGNFIDSDSNQLSVSATLTQTTEPDGNGQFELSGSATFPNNPCFTQPTIVTSSLVTGSTLSTTYTDPVSSATVTAVGTFNSAATQLTVTNWSVSGGLCNGDSGTGLLTEPE